MQSCITVSKSDTACRCIRTPRSSPSSSALRPFAAPLQPLFAPAPAPVPALLMPQQLAMARAQGLSFQAPLALLAQQQQLQAAAAQQQQLQAAAAQQRLQAAAAQAAWAAQAAQAMSSQSHAQVGIRRRRTWMGLRLCLRSMPTGTCHAHFQSVFA